MRAGEIALRGQSGTVLLSNGSDRTVTERIEIGGVQNGLALKQRRQFLSDVRNGAIGDSKQHDRSKSGGLFRCSC